MQHVVITSVLVLAIGTGLTPLWGSLVVCHIVLFMVGGAVGLIETATNFWIYAIWKEKSGPVFQLINFAFGLGGVVAPMIAAPFLNSAQLE